MNALTITAKGQVTLKKELLRHLGVQPGDKISLSQLPGGKIEMAAARGTGKISDAFGILKREGQTTLSIEDMNDLIARGWAGEL